MLPPDYDLPEDELNAQKSGLRAQIRAARRAIPEAERIPRSQSAATIFIANFIVPRQPSEPRLRVAGFWPSRAEIKVDLLLAELKHQNVATCLPEVIAHGLALIFREWSHGEPLVAGNGAEVPLPSARIVQPDLVIVPLIGFDRRGGRLGQGGGFYDRSLQALRRDRAITAVGIAYAEQEVAAIPRGEFDQPLDAIVTDRELIIPSDER
ncbi:MAG: 5-formyltetrahydrofolate cyclo-ligase [Alphaproteobacteria bacterium]|nr:5-formyltetrahydrofolate cyclo-ligase [Alphaproteobacteria bacterium]